MAVGGQPQLYWDPLPVFLVTDPGSATDPGILDPTSLAVTSSSAQLVPARAARRGGILTNVGAGAAYVRFGAGAATTAGGYHLVVQPNSSIALPPHATGSINVIGAPLSSSTITLAEW